MMGWMPRERKRRLLHRNEKPPPSADTMKSISNTIHHAIAMHLDVSLDMIDDAHRLSEDLCLTPIDLVSIMLEVESTHLGSDEFPAETLDGVDTVGELVTIFEEWASRRDTYEDIDASNMWGDRITLNP